MTTFEHPIGEKNRRKIIHAVTDLGGRNISWTQIKKQIEENAARQVRMDRRHNLHAQDKEKRIKGLSMSEEALSKNLKRLVQLGVLEKNKDGLYSFTADLRNYAPVFGSRLLSSVLQFPLTADIGKNFSELIKRYGVLLIFILIEGSRKVKDVSMTVKERDELALEWVKNAIPIEQMFDTFQAMYRPEDRRYDGTESLCEIPDQTLDLLHKELKLQYPSIYNGFQQVSGSYMGQHKERSLSKNRRNPGHFIYPSD